jgi:hypothetical protein
MKKAESTSDDLRPEYRREDFAAMERGKYAARVKESSNVVLLDPDVAAVFPNAEAVNQALRKLIEIAKSSVQSPSA